MMMEKIAVWPISVYTTSDECFGRETLEDHSQLHVPKKANKYSVGTVASFMYIL